MREFPFSKQQLSLSCCFAALLCFQNATGLVTEFQGQTSSGAYYSIAIPENWSAENGLVIWNHGYQGYTTTSLEANPSLGPLQDIVLEQGYAIAASSYSQTGWAVFNSPTDNQQLVEKFVELAGQPGKILIQGGSLGGIVTIRDLEAGLIPDVDGALLLCGAVAGSRNWYDAFDLRMVYEAVCSDEPSAKLPTDNWYQQPDPIIGEIDFLDSLERCTGYISTELSGVPFGELLRSSEQNQRLNKILSLTGIEIDFLLLGLGYAVFEIPNLVNDISKLNGAKPFGNAGIDYGDEQVNALVRRSAALPSARDRFLENYSPNGNIGTTKLVSIHTSRDGLVRVENQQVLKNLVSATQLTTAIVVEDEASHCGFTDDEGLAAWNNLLSWVATDSQPTAQDILDTCQEANSDPGQCRYDAAYQIVDTLPAFPRNNNTATVGSNSFDAATGIVTIESLQVDNTVANYNLQLLPPPPGSSLFEITNVESNESPGGWQHRPLFFSEDLLLYLPNLKILQPAPNVPDYTVYFRYITENGRDGLQVLEYEAVNN